MEKINFQAMLFSLLTVLFVAFSMIVITKFDSSWWSTPLSVFLLLIGACSGFLSARALILEDMETYKDDDDVDFDYSGDNEDDEPCD